MINILSQRVALLFYLLTWFFLRFYLQEVRYGMFGFWKNMYCSYWIWIFKLDLGDHVHIQQDQGLCHDMPNLPNAHPPQQEIRPIQSWLRDSGSVHHASIASLIWLGWVQIVRGHRHLHDFALVFLCRSFKTPAASATVEQHNAVCLLFLILFCINSMISKKPLPTLDLFVRWIFWGFYQWGCHPPCFVSPWWVFTRLWNAKSPGPKPKKGLCCLPHGVWKMMLWRMLGRLNRKKTMVSSAGKNLVLGSLCKKMAPMCWFQPELNTQGHGAMIHTCSRAALSIFINTHVVPWGHLNYLFWIILGGSNISKYCW